MANKYMNRCSASLAIRKMYTKKTHNEVSLYIYLGFLGGSMVKNLPDNARRCRRCELDP